MEARLTALETKWDTVIPTLATKADLAEVEGRLRVEMHKGFAEVNHRFDERFAEVNGRFAEVSNRFAEVNNRFADVNRMLADLQKWVIGTIFTTVAVLASVAALGFNIAGPRSQSLSWREAWASIADPWSPRTPSALSELMGPAIDPSIVPMSLADLRMANS